MEFTLDQWKNQRLNGFVVVNYQGNINSEDTESILSKIESYLHKNEKDHQKIKKIYNVCVECIQNLYHHVDENPINNGGKGNPKYGLIILRKDDDVYKISTGNFLSNNKKKNLKDRIDQINFLNTDQIKYLYRMILKNEYYTEKGGGGLGMIDIARKTGNKIFYDFFDYDDEYLFFSIDITII